MLFRVQNTKVLHDNLIPYMTVMLPSSVMRGTLEPQTDPLLDLLEFPMGENPGGRKPNYKKTQKLPIFKNIIFFLQIPVHISISNILKNLQS